jgi:ectoine hydroxylase-related dioxygenase (phytanoyl-CoA dioxygenase family)
MKTIPLLEGPFPSPTTDLEQVKADIVEFGYGIVKDVLSQPQVATLKSVITAEIEKEEKAGQIKESYTDRDNTNRRLNVLMDRHECFLDLIDHPMVMEIAPWFLGESYLNESFLLHGLSANVTYPGCKDMGVHGDTDNLLPHINVPVHLRVIWCIDDFDEEVGATRVVPKSHLLGKYPEKDGSVKYETLAAVAPAGSALIYDGRLYHGTGANNSKDRQRAAIISGYIQPWMRPLACYPMILNPKAIEKASEQCREILGYGTVHLGFDQPWRHATKEVTALTIGQKRSIEEMRAEVRQD